MKLKITSCLIIWIICFSVNAQNLIPNGDFELGPDSSSSAWCCGFDSTCIILNNTTPGPTYWTVVNSTPDRMVYGDIPCNWDNDTAVSGKAYIVIGWNEAGKTTLQSFVEKDSIYRLTYYIALNTFRGSYTQPCQFYFKFINTNDSIFSPLIIDTNWVYIDTIFIATENANEIEIRGCIWVPSGANIDMIWLEKINPNSINNLYRNQIKFYPIPTSDKIHFNLLPEDTKQIVISNLSGQIITSLNKNEISNNSIDVSSLNSGLYFLTIKTKNNVITNKITIIK